MYGLADIKRMNEDAAARQTVEHKPEDAACPAAEAGVAALGDKLAGGLPVDGWIRHTPGKMPVPGDTRVEAETRGTWRLGPCCADELNWSEVGFGTIAFYRIAATPAHIMPLPKRPDIINFDEASSYADGWPVITAPAVTTKDSHGSHLPTDAKARKALPICTGVLDYFPDALAAVAEISRIGNDQHNPGQPLHWSKGKSTDHADCAIRHFAERGTRDTDGGRHTAKAAWRVLALLQMEIEAERAGLSFNDYIAKLNREAA
jgi:hypothetical protein